MKEAIGRCGGEGQLVASQPNDSHSGKMSLCTTLRLIKKCVLDVKLCVCSAIHGHAKPDEPLEFYIKTLRDSGFSKPSSWRREEAKSPPFENSVRTETA